MINEKRHAQVLKDLAAMAKKQVSKNELKDYLLFIEGFYPASSPDDLLMRPVEELYAISDFYWNAGKKRTPGEAQVKVFNPTTKDGLQQEHTVILIINDDMPFIVDSITGGLTGPLRTRLHMVHHPMLDLTRNEKGGLEKIVGIPPAGSKPDIGITRESLLYIEIDTHSDKEALAEMSTAIQGILDDVRICVKDWRAMMAKVDETVASLTVNPPPIPEEDTEEAIRFLRWLSADHFTFIGYREYRFEGDPETFDFEQVDGSSLGILRGADRYVLRGRDGLTAMSPEIRHFLKQPDPVIITKANVKSTVHRNSHLDYVGVKIFDQDGKVVGERRFVGLLTSLSYSRSVTQVPILREKIAKIKRRSLFDESSHIGKVMMHILETYPRDELFQVDADLMFKTAMGIVQLLERPHAQAFLRRDKFERFVSAIVYVPRENYHSGLRENIAKILCDAFNGEISVYFAHMGNENLARWHFIIRTQPGQVLDANEDAINKAIVHACRGWQDRLLVQLVDRFGEEDGNRLFRLYKDRFSMGYREAFNASQAAYDIESLETLADSGGVGFDFYKHLADGDNNYRLKIHNNDGVVPLSDCLPMLENMGFRVVSEHSYDMADKSSAFIHDFNLSRTEPIDISIDTVKPILEDLLVNVWKGKAEDDEFNALLMKTGMQWDQIVILRAYGKYLRQLGLGYTPEYIAQCLLTHSELALKLVEIFDIRFNPKTKGARGEQAKAIAKDYIQELDQVSSLDEDRILRAYLSVMEATLRTNFYQDGVMDMVDERALAFKIRSRQVEEAPLPRPYAEIWVYSPRVEGVHLRGGPVARGGLRWSDRREDFRTEVLGLVKAQQVKNTVIVPQGAKGGFFAKQLPGMDDREAFMKEGVSAYRSFISSLLSITDNLMGGKVVPPKGVFRRDDDDPYLVVAADKGTATFSDIANSISQDNNFWLGDAFASGGSKGYDHKGMGITAKGAWVSVQRHFRELGINVQDDPISVIGVGDMSGDVFGNGMLLSKTIELKAAFNHMHIFLDPNPVDAKKNWKERKRLFDLPRSSWTDYDQSLISKGGGIFSRSDKSIPLSKEVQKWLGVSVDKMAPNALLNQILKTKADLLWFGGIGTYVRSSDETDADVGDRANNAIRVTAEQLHVKAVGEGGNLGMTQKSRIEFAARGGRLNTDFIDNSAGVDCSDKEVNIKILLADVLESGKMTDDERDQLLVEMTDEVSSIVLTDNYLQTQAISLTEVVAAEHRDSHAGLMRTLEREGLLNREIEYLPSDERLQEMAAQEKGLSRPEISTLMSYAKMSLYDILLDGEVVNNPIFQPELEWSFPTALREKFPEEMKRHRLRKELVATVLCNEVVNWAGLSFVYDIKEETGLAVEDIVAAFVIVREVYHLKFLWGEINALDYKIESRIQYEMHSELQNFIRHQVLWLLRNLPQPFDIKDIINRFSGAVDGLIKSTEELMSKSAVKMATKRLLRLNKHGVKGELARQIAGIDAFRQVPDIIAVAEETKRDVSDVALVYYSIGEEIGFDWLRSASQHVIVEDRWDLLALRAGRDDLADQQRVIASLVLEGSGNLKPKAAVEAWLDREKTRVIRAERMLADLKSSGTVSLSKISFAVRHLRSILR